LYSISFPPNPNEDQSVEVTKGGEDLDSDEEIPVIEVVETLRGQITQEGEQESPVLVESDDILGVDPSPDLETSVREFPQVVEPEQNLGAAIQENTMEIGNLTDTAQVRESEKVLTVTDGTDAYHSRILFLTLGVTRAPQVRMPSCHWAHRWYHSWMLLGLIGQRWSQANDPVERGLQLPSAS